MGTVWGKKEQFKFVFLDFVEGRRAGTANFEWRQMDLRKGIGLDRNSWFEEKPAWRSGAVKGLAADPEHLGGL